MSSSIKALINSTKRSKVYKPLVWIDCEMTGLNISTDRIIEICCIITDGNLNILDPDGYESTVYCDDSILLNMNEWCITTHKHSGLYDKVLANPQNTLSKVQDELLAYIKRFIDPKVGILAGNSVHMDKFFMVKEFPNVIDYLHYRLVDVSSIAEVGLRHNPNLLKYQPRKSNNHTAKLDILESINQLKWLENNYLKPELESLELIKSYQQQQ